MGPLRNVGAAAPGLVTPESDNAPWQGRVAVAEEVVEKPDCAGLPAQAQPRHDKLFATLQAKLALAGFQLTKDGHGGFVVASWGRHRDLDSLAAVEAFARQVGVLR